MRWIVLLAAALAAFGLAGAAHAGCMATVGLGSLPDGVAPGETWSLDLDVLQHGRTPLADAQPVVILTNEATAEECRFPATPTGTTGTYHANVVFPGPGDWAVAVNDGFPVEECAQTHTFGSFGIGVADQPPSPPPSEPALTAAAPPAAPDEFPYWALGLGATLLAAVAVVLVMRFARARPRSPRDPLPGP